MLVWAFREKREGVHKEGSSLGVAASPTGLRPYLNVVASLQFYSISAFPTEATAKISSQSQPAPQLPDVFHFKFD